MTWDECQKWESQWHGNCVATEFGERLKQTVYAPRMGLKFSHDSKSPFNIDCAGMRIVDIGGGPYSMLLFCRNVHGLIVDPCVYPQWVYDRYDATCIDWVRVTGEDFKSPSVRDEAWVYNCLQHVQNPAKVIENTRCAAKLIRLFEWIDTGASDGHPHNLTEDMLNDLLHGEGHVEELNDRQRGCVGRCYYGIFPT